MTMDARGVGDSPETAQLRRVEAYSLSVFRPRTRIFAAVTCVVACGCSGGAKSTETSSTVTVTQTVTSAAATASPAEDVWLEIDHQGEAPSPVFPSTLKGWRRVDTWSQMPRAFTGSWTDVAGPDYGTFPATMNGCDDQLFLVRWRSIAEGAPVQASWTHGPLRGDELTTDAGWMSVDGCQTPQFRVAHSFSGGSNLTDVTVDVQAWTPAP